MLRRSVDDPSFVIPLMVWLAAQLIALLLAAGHVRLWAGASIATESLAVSELLIVQFIASSLLFPFLYRGWQSAAAMVLASLPMIALAGVLADVQNFNCLAVAIDLSLWLFGLYFWRRRLSSPSAQLIAVSLLTSLNITAILLAYLAAEMSNVPLHLPFVPLFSALTMVQAPTIAGFSVSLIWLAVSALATKFAPTSYPQYSSTATC